MYHLAVCDMMSGQLSFPLRILYHWKAVICRFSAIDHILYICNISISVKAACLVISGASNGPFSCFWYDEWSTELPVEYLISLESCDIQLSNSTHYICITSIYESKWPIWWSLVHQMDHLAVCDMMGGTPSFIMRMLYHWQPVKNPTTVFFCSTWASFSTLYRVGTSAGLI